MGAENSLVKIDSDAIASIPNHVELFNIPIPIQSIIENQKGKLLSDLRPLTAAADFAHTIDPGEMYTVIVQDKEAWLSQADKITKELPGVVRDNGKISEHIKLKKVGVNTVKIAKSLGMQFLLVSIAIQIKELDHKLSGLITSFHDSRIAKTLSGVEMLRDGLSMGESQNRNSCLLNAAQTLREGIADNIKQLKAAIEGCPSEKTGFFDGWGISSGIDCATEKMRMAQETAVTLAQGTQALFFCYALLTPPEHDTAINTVYNLINKISSEIDFVQAHRKLALVPKGASSSKEDQLFWSNLWAQFDTFSRRLKNTPNDVTSAAIQISGAELLEGESHGDM